MKNYQRFIALLVLPLLLCAQATNSFADVLSTTFYHNNALGSPVAATDESGNVKWREQYRPYGEKMVNELEAVDNSRWYTAHPHDEDTGLTYAGARYYDPAIGRFMGVDPVGALAAVDNPMMFNRYAYGNNNPYRYVDPDGRNPRDIDGDGDSDDVDFDSGAILTIHPLGRIGLGGSIDEDGNVRPYIISLMLKSPGVAKNVPANFKGLSQELKDARSIAEKAFKDPKSGAQLRDSIPPSLRNQLADRYKAVAKNAANTDSTAARRAAALNTDRVNFLRGKTNTPPGNTKTNSKYRDIQ